MMRFYSFFDFESSSPPFRVGVLCLSLALLCAGTLSIYYHALPNSDIAWLLTAAERWLNGGQFGQAIYELNTPFAVLLYAPAVTLGTWLNITPIFMTALLTTAVGASTLFLSAAVLRFRAYESFNTFSGHYFFLLAGFASFLLIPSQSFGQRDHIVSALMLPYLLLIFSPQDFRENLAEKKTLVNILCILSLALALFIKPQYSITALAAHFFSFYFNKKFSLLKYGVALIVTIIAIEFLFIYTFFPGWFSITKDTITTYSTYENTILLVLFCLLFFSIIPLALTTFIENKTLTSLFKLPFHRMMFLISLANALTFIYQSKGWYYQALPFMLPLWTLVLFLLFNKYQHKRFIFIIVVIVVATFNYLTITLVKKNYFSDPRSSWMLHHVKALSKPGDNFLCLSNDISCAFPTAMLSHTTSISRYGALWPTAGAKLLWKNGTINRSLFDYYLNRDLNNTLEDMQSAPPKIIVIEWQRTATGTIEDFSEHTRFASALSKNYKLYQQKNYPEAWSIWIFTLKK